MTFLCNGRTYSAAQMRTFHTGDPNLPAIYLTDDGRSTFVTRRDPDGSMEAYRAGTAEIIALARRYQLDALLGAFPARFAVADILPESAEDLEALAGRCLPGRVEASRAGARE